MKATIHNRIDPCGCGCKGADPWHAKTFKRVLQDVRDEVGSVKIRHRGRLLYLRRAVVQLPWGRVQVAEVVPENLVVMLGDHVMDPQATRHSFLREWWIVDHGTNQDDEIIYDEGLFRVGEGEVQARIDAYKKGKAEFDALMEKWDAEEEEGRS